MLFPTFFLSLFLVGVYGLFDCANLRCNPCAGSNNKVDYVFLIDDTGSMQEEIDGVTSGLVQFTRSVQNRSIDARYCGILFGAAPENIVDFTSDPQRIITTFPLIRDAQEVPGVHYYHNNREAGFELMRMSQGAAAYNIFTRTNAALTWRSDALRFAFFVTDEDGDVPHYQVNSFPGQNWPNQEPPNSISTTANDGFNRDRITGTDAIIGNAVYILMLVNPSDTPVLQQYGCPAADVSDANYGNFDPAATLTRLSSSTCGSQDSSQATILRAGLFVRCFLISEILKPNFVSAFFQVAVDATPACEGTATCFDATCDINTGCVYKAKCDNVPNPGDNSQCTNNCYIGGVCYGFSEKEPGNACSSCDPGHDAWIGCGDADVCTEDICDRTGLGCSYDSQTAAVCTQACNKCFIDGVCYNVNDPHPLPNAATKTDCLYCDPFTNDKAWSNMTFLPRCSPLPTPPPPEDRDGDGFFNVVDNCPDAYNPSQLDSDGDGRGDVCDPCPFSPDDFGTANLCGTPSISSDPAASICSGHGYCGCTASGSGGPACVCDPGFYGSKCENPVVCDTTVSPVFVRANCNQRGTCSIQPGQREPSCVCDPSWTTADCSRQVLCSGCSNQFSTCIADNVCSCTASGMQYDPAIQNCAPYGYCPPTGCLNGGTCNTAKLGTAGFGCECPTNTKIDTTMASPTYGACVPCAAGTAGCVSSGGVPEGGSCASGSCLAGLVCHSTSKICVKPCSTSTDCSSDLPICIKDPNGVQNSCGATCTSATDCPSGSAAAKTCTRQTTADGNQALYCSAYTSGGSLVSVTVVLLALLL